MVQKVSFLCCQFCSYKTRFTGNLAKHIRTHTGERPFKCQFCGKGFASKSNYNTHVVIHTPGGSPSGKLSSGASRLGLPQGRLRRSSLHRQFTSSDINSDIVRSMPVVKTLLSSNRSTPRSVAQQLSPIGSFLMPDRINTSYSHTALYSSINFASFGGALSHPNQNDSALDEIIVSDRLDPVSGDSDKSSPEVTEVIHHNGRSIIGEDDVKPTIFDIFNMLPSAHRMRRSRDMMDVAMIKEEAIEEEPEVMYMGNRSGHHRRRIGSICPETRTARDSSADLKVANGNCSQATGNMSDDDQNQLHTQMLIDTLIKESRLYRCEPCNILFPEYGMYVLHLGCHGNESAYQCHFCQQSFDNKFSFATHFVRCPHDESRCQ